jgi:heme-degrading monooxygenase HmoA
MITVANRIYVTPEYYEEFEERFRNRARLVDGMPGFISNQVLRPVDEQLQMQLNFGANNADPLPEDSTQSE